MFDINAFTGAVVTEVRWIPFTVLSVKLSDGEVRYLNVDEARRVFGERLLKEAQRLRHSRQWIEV